MVGHESLISQARSNQAEHTGRGLGKARQNQLQPRLSCSAAGFPTYGKLFREHTHLDQEGNEEACYTLKAKTPQARSHVMHQQTSI